MDSEGRSYWWFSWCELPRGLEPVLDMGSMLVREGRPVLPPK